MNKHTIKGWICCLSCYLSQTWKHFSITIFTGQNIQNDVEQFTNIFTISGLLKQSQERFSRDMIYLSQSEGQSPVGPFASYVSSTESQARAPLALQSRDKSPNSSSSSSSSSSSPASFSACSSCLGRGVLFTISRLSLSNSTLL